MPPACLVVLSVYAKNGRRPLTEVQIEVLEYVKTYIHDNGYPPTHREIASWFGWSSARSAADVLDRLEAKGMVKLAIGRARGIRVVP